MGKTDSQLVEILERMDGISVVPSIISDIADDVYCFRTGSTEFGVNTEISDIDYIITPKNLDKYYKIYDYLTEHKCLSSNKSSISCKNSVKLRQGNITFDIILKDHKEFLIWNYTTKLMKKLPVKLIKSKHHRVDIFEAYLRLLKQ